MTRQLAAILYSDMTENTGVTGESMAMHKLLVEKHHGTWLREMNAGVMAKFQSALDAVQCAIELQQAASSEFNEQIRIGVHLGDITIDGDEISGDGVNVAIAIASVAEPGSIYISEGVQGAIKGSKILTSFRGERKLKNLDQTARVYQVVDEGEALPVKSTGKNYLPWLAGLLLVAAFSIWKLSGDQPDPVSGRTIAVLPLTVNKPDSTSELLMPGITEELVRSISKLRTLTVVNPKSTMRFMASVVPVAEATRSLDKSDYFLTGTLDHQQNQIELNLSLLDRQQKELWSQTYAGDMYELPKLAAAVALDLADYVNINLEQSDVARIVDIPPVEPESFRLMLLGKNHLAKFTLQDIVIGLNYLRQAVEKNPTSSRAWSNLAEGLIMMGHSPAPSPGIWEEAREAASRALQLDSLNAEAWAWLGTTKTYYHWDYDGAVNCYNKANTLNPNLPMSHYHYSWHLHLFDSMAKAVEEHEIAFELDPLDPFQAARLGHIYMIAGDMDKALAELRRSQQLQKDFIIADNVLGQYYLNTQQFDSAEYYFKKTHIFGKGQLAATYLAWGKPEKAWEIIREMETNTIPYYAVGLAMLYSNLGNTDKFFEYANFPQPHAFHPWLRVMVKNPEIIADPRFKQLMDKMNLPMPDSARRVALGG